MQALAHIIGDELYNQKKFKHGVSEDTVPKSV